MPDATRRRDAGQERDVRGDSLDERRAPVRSCSTAPRSSEPYPMLGPSVAPLRRRHSVQKATPPTAAVKVVSVTRSRAAVVCASATSVSTNAGAATAVATASSGRTCAWPERVEPDPARANVPAPQDAVLSDGDGVLGTTG